MIKRSERTKEKYAKAAAELDMLSKLLLNTKNLTELLSAKDIDYLCKFSTITLNTYRVLLESQSAKDFSGKVAFDECCVSDIFFKHDIAKKFTDYVERYKELKDLITEECNEFKVIANITVPVDDVTEQAFREGYIKGKSEDSRIIQIANHYGYTAQADITVEECAELTQAICKLRRAWSNERLENVKEELADVLIMARQLRVMLGADDIDKIIGEKLDRQIERIAEEKRTAENICTCYRDGRCWGTQHMEKCECGGNEKICDFYPTKRNKDETA